MSCSFDSRGRSHGIGSDLLAFATSSRPVAVRLCSEEAGVEDLVVPLGPRPERRLAEVMDIGIAAGDLLVVHAMDLRARCRDAYRRVM